MWLPVGRADCLPGLLRYALHPLAHRATHPPCLHAGAEPKRIRKILSGPINFAKFREMQMGTVDMILVERGKARTRTHVPQLCRK
jgi:hypothetical protein